MIDAAQRVELTRARLRKAMTPPPPAPRRIAKPGKVTWLEKAKHLPVVGVVVDALDSWWMHHPLRPVTQVVGEASNAAVQPLAQSNPITLVVGAAVAGAALAWSRPWRWMLRSALFAGIVPQIATRIISRLPVETWMARVDTPRT
jgi:hypothetical protein